ncbi:hypothetical protein SUGI_0721270 [Cryptomeria japonica]|nr:hypothetical protein SUGI_0721270 [Cryptomeria japonica]
MAASLLFLGVLSLFVRSAWGGSSDVQVGLVLMQHVENGQGFKIIGNQKDLGYWNISKGLPMTNQKGDLWTASLEIEFEDLNSEYDLEYKVVVVDQDYGEREVCSMSGPNRALNIPKNFDTNYVYFVHGGSSDVQIGFVMMQHVECGQEFRIVGNRKELGDWDISKGCSMTYHKGDLWTASVEIEIEDFNGEDDLEYKIDVVDQDYSEKVVCSMPGPKRVMKLPKDVDTNDVYFVHVIWDINTCATSCSETAACGNSSHMVNTL